jgi:membrane-bound lytic murein transglycosylase F
MSFLWLGTAVIRPDAAPARGSRILRRGLPALLFLLVVCLPLAGCAPPVKEKAAPARPVVDLEQIRARGKLVAATGYGATSYFIYKGRPMGFEYELLVRLARHLDVELEILILTDMDRMFEILDTGEADIIGLGLTVTRERAEKLSFTAHHDEIRQVLVQRKPPNWRKMRRESIDDALVRSPVELLGKQVYVWGGSSYCARLENLAEELGGDIEIVEVPGSLSTEDLISMVSRGEIEYTVADENIAIIAQAHHANIDVRTPVSLPQRIAWAVRKSSTQLLEAVNLFMEEARKGKEFNVIYNKYYRNRSAYRARAKSPYTSAAGGKISQWDDLIQSRADDIGWDWRLLTALMYQESRFDPGERSWAGAMGLMQLLPETAARYGVHDLYNPESNIEAGTRHLVWLDEIWGKLIPDDEERVKFILASYNAGSGHVLDARRLALKYGRDPSLWDGHTAEYLRRKSQRLYFNDPVVQHGYCRGQEPYDYVEEILERYEHYKRHWAARPGAGDGVVEAPLSVLPDPLTTTIPETAGGTVE